MRFVVTKVDGSRSYAVTRRPFTIDGGGGTGGSSSSSAGTAIDIQPVRISTGSPELSANFTAATGSMLEGETRTFSARLTRPLDSTAVVGIRIGDTSTTASGASSLSAARLAFFVGQTEAFFDVTSTDFAGGSSSTVTVVELFQLDPDAPDLEGFIVVEPLASEGPISLAVTIQDETVGNDPPTWSFGVPAAFNEDEASGEQLYSIQLSRVAEQPQTFVVSQVGGDAEDPRDFTGLPVTVTIPAGDSLGQFGITYTDNTLQPFANPTLQVSAVAQGTATLGAVTSFTVTILDNDDGGAGSGITRINWVGTSVSMAEGETRTLTAQLTRNGTPQGFDTAIEVPVRVSGDLAEFTYDFDGGQQGRLLFAAGATQSRVRLTSVANETPGQVVLEFNDDDMPLATLRTGPQFRATVNSVSQELEPTTLFISDMAGDRRMAQSLVAVVPPSTALPEYKIAGERCRVVGMMRNAEGEWISAYVYGFAPATASFPGEANAIPIEIASSTDPAPPEEAQGFVEPPPLRFTLTTNDSSGGTLTHTCWAGSSVNGLGSEYPTPRTWTGPGGVWDEVGPDIYQEREYFMRPMQGSTSSQTLLMTSPQTLGYIELCEKRIAGDEDVILYEGQWVNGAWASQRQNNVDPLGVNPFCDGEVESLRSIQAIVANSSGNDGWSIRGFDLHPAQGQNLGDDQRLFLLRRPGSDTTPFFFPTCQAYTFRFALVRETVAGAFERAQDYHRCKSIGWAVGGLGSTRQRMFGDFADSTIDWGRPEAAFFDSVTNTNGWRAIKEIATDFEEGYDGQAGWLQSWTSGDAFNPTAEAGTDRNGWHRPIYRDEGGGSAGAGIYGSNALVPYAGYWYTATQWQHYNACRQRYQYRDVTNGAVPFWWELSELDGAGGFQSVISGTEGRKTARNRHWHLCGPFDIPKMDFDGAELDALLLAPTDRPWNSTTTPDPAKSQIAAWETYHETHMTRDRPQHNDGWHAMRSYLAYKMYEGRAAMITRAHMPIRHYGWQGDFSSNQASFESLLAAQAQRPEWRGRGLQISRLQVHNTGDFLRAWGWVQLIASGYYAIAPTNIRQRLRGVGMPTNAPAIDWMGNLAEVMEFITEDSGLQGRSYRKADPDPTNPATYGPTDYINRIGALPGETSGADTNFSAPGFPGQPGDAVWLPFALGFHQVFCVKGVGSMRRLVFDYTGSPYPDYCARTLRWYQRFVNSARVVTDEDGPPLVPHGAVNVFDINWQGFSYSSAAVPRVLTAEQYEAGAAYWFSDGIDSGGRPGPVGWDVHKAKTGWAVTAALHALGEQDHEVVVRAVYRARNASDQEMIDLVLRGNNGPGDVQTEMTSISSSRRIKVSISSRSYLISYVADLLNRIS